MKLLLLLPLFFILSHSKYLLVETYDDSIDAGKQGESNSLRDDDKTDRLSSLIEEKKKGKNHNKDVKESTSLRDDDKTDRLSSLIEEKKKGKNHNKDVKGKDYENFGCPRL